MDITVLDQAFQEVHPIEDPFSSLVWTDRYIGAGEFELACGVTAENLLYLQADNYLRFSESDRVMIIEGRTISTKADGNNLIIARGHSLETVLSRRVVWDMTVVTGSFESAIEDLIADAIILPDIEEREMLNFLFVPSGDAYIESLTIDEQYHGNNLYTVIKNLCESKNVGFKVTLSDDNLFVFQLYRGADRSYNQEVYPHVIFAPNMDNLVSSEYIEDKTTYKNVALVLGEGEGYSRITIDAEVPSAGANSGLDRREMTVEASDMSQNGPEGTITLPTYLGQLIQRGLENLYAAIFEKSLDAEIDTSRMFVYRVDYQLGDTVQVEDEYGNTAASLIEEVVHSHDPSGIKVYPRFKTMN